MHERSLFRGPTLLGVSTAHRCCNTAATGYTPCVVAIEILALAILLLCAAFLGAVMLRSVTANRQHWKDVGYKRKGLFLDRPPEDSGAPWILQERERNNKRPRREEPPI